VRRRKRAWRAGRLSKGLPLGTGVSGIRNAGRRAGPSSAPFALPGPSASAQAPRPPRRASPARRAGQEPGGSLSQEAARERLPPGGLGGISIRSGSGGPREAWGGLKRCPPLTGAEHR